MNGENILRACKIERKELGAVEYRLEVRTVLMEDTVRQVPDEYVVHTLADRLREFVNSAQTDEVIDLVVKRGIPTVCPMCGREVDGR